jgi:hypothetical protein
MNFQSRSRPIPLLIVVTCLQLFTLVFLSTARAQVVEGRVYRESSGPEVYLISAGKKIWVPTADALFAMGFDWSSVTVVPDGTLNAFPRVNIPSLSLTPGSLIFPPDNVKYFPLVVVPSSIKAISQGKEVQLVELYGWMRRVEDTCNADDLKNAPNGRDWHYDLELDTDQALAQGIDLNRIFRVGNVAAVGLMLPGFHPRHSVSLPLIHIECNSWNWGGLNTGRPKPNDWVTGPGVAQCDINTSWPFNQPGAGLWAQGFDNPRGPYVRVTGSLLTDSPHDVQTRPSTVLSRQFGITDSDDAEWEGSVPDWNPGLSSDAPNHFARWTELHPPDLIEVEPSPPPFRVTVRAVALAARVGVLPFGLSNSCEEVNFDIFPEPSRPPGAHIGYEERRGPETYWPWGEDANNGSWITGYDDHVHIKARVCGGPVFGSPGRFKAIYRVWWQVAPSLLTLTTAVTPQPKAGMLQAYTYTVTNAATGAPVPQATVTLHNFSSNLAQTSTNTTDVSGKVSFTAKLNRKTVVVTGEGPGNPLHDTSTTSPTLSVQKAGYHTLSITLLED